MYKPEDKHRKIGLEYEFLAINLETGLAITRDEVKEIWRNWGKKENVETYFDYGTKQPVGVIYTQEDGQEVIINTDAGTSVIEFGFLPFATLEECEKNMRKILKEFLEITNKIGIGLIDTGLQPKTPSGFPDLKSEKIWYRIVTLLPSFAQKHSDYHNISAHQVCIDMKYDEAVVVTNTLNALGGATIALFANSGVGEWKIQNCHEIREDRWDKLVEDLDEKNQRMCGIPKKPFKTFRDYIEYNWSVLMPGIFRGKTLHNISPLIDIKDYFRKDKWETFDLGNVMPSEVEPSVADVNELNMYIWTQARPKIFFDEKQSLQSLLEAYDNNKIDEYAKEHAYKLYIETRNMASQPWDSVMSTPAFILGLVENIEKAKEIVDAKPWEYWRELREKTIAKSMEVEEVIPIVKQLVEIAEEGLKKRGLGEEKYLKPLHERVEKEESPAMKNIKDFNEKGIEDYIKDRIIKI